jgi:hypothetical protein
MYGRSVSVFGQDLGGALGRAVAVGDINGDGAFDIITSAGILSTNIQNLAQGPQGDVYCFLGSRNLSTTQPTVYDVATGGRYQNTSQASFTITGADLGDNLGSTMLVANINGDRMDDIILGAQGGDGTNNQRSSCGEVHIILGSAAPASRNLAQTSADVTIQGSVQNERLGFSMITGDVNGDGTRDLILGTPISDGPTSDRDVAGRVIALYGGASLTGRPIRDLSQAGQGADVTIVGANVADQIGASVASGDFNGDRIDDVITSSAFADGPMGLGRAKAGVTYVVYGRR